VTLAWIASRNKSSRGQKKSRKRLSLVEIIIFFIYYGVMNYTHLTAYSEQAVELFGEPNAKIDITANDTVYSDPANEDDHSLAVDPYASQEVYDAYSAQIDNAEKVYDNKKDDTNFVFSDIKASLETTYASADPYFEDQTREDGEEGKSDEDSSESEGESQRGTSKPESTSFAVKDWNEDFQQLLQTEDNYDKFVNLGQLAQEFVYTAQTYGRVIISELSVPIQNKTIRPTSIGGAAGGEKYIVNGILFKFALDFNGIYGGDENAAKAAGHDLKGSVHFFLASEPGLHLPLMALINYMGFCLVAMSLLPISSKTLKYGSSDSGVTVHADDDDLFNKMADTAKRLNLKGHYVGALRASMRLIYGPGDLEGHLGNDGRYYVIDFARLFPPEAPIDESKEKGRILYKLLRPELVATNAESLSSDAFTGWAVLDKQHGPTNNKEVLDCTKRLLFEVIPKFAEDLKARSREYHAALYTNIPSELHRYGINVRYAGHVRRLVRDTLWSQVLLSFIISRTVSSIIRKKWRKIISTSKYITEQKCKEIAIEILNQTFMSMTPGHKEFVNGKLRKNMKRKFKFAFFDDENVEDFDYVAKCFQDLASTSRSACFKNITMQLGLEISTTAEQSISLENGLLVRRDVIAIHPRVKHMNVIDIAEAQEMLYSAIYGDGAKSHFEHILRYFKNTIENAPHLVKYQIDYVLKGSKTYRKRFKMGILDADTVTTNVSYLIGLFRELFDNERDNKTKFLLAVERCKLICLGFSLITDFKTLSTNFAPYNAVVDLVSLNSESYSGFELYLDFVVQSFRKNQSGLTNTPYLAELFTEAEQKFKDDTKFQLLTVRYYLFRLTFFKEDHSEKIIELLKGIQKPDHYLPKLLNTKKLAFLNREQFGYETFNKVLNVARSVPEFSVLLQQIVAIERKLCLKTIDVDHLELLKKLTPVGGFVSLKVKGVEQAEIAIGLLDLYLVQSPDLTYLEMEGFPELPPNWVERIESNKKITHLKLLQVGPAQVVLSIMQALAANLESCAVGEVDLAQDQFLELLMALPKTLKELRLSSPRITNDVLADPELSELLNNVLQLDLTDCTSISTEAVDKLVALPKITRLVLTGCTGISDQKFYGIVYSVPSRSLLQLVTHHGDVLEYQNDNRRVYAQRLGPNLQLVIRDIKSETVAMYYWKQIAGNSFNLIESRGELTAHVTKTSLEKSAKIRGHTYAAIRELAHSTTIQIDKIYSSVNMSGLNLILPGATVYKQTKALMVNQGVCMTLLLPVYCSLTQFV
jgi:hypothetical protein